MPSDPSKPARISNSFTPGEVKLLRIIISAITRGGDIPSGVTRHASWSKLVKRLQRMNERAEQIERAADARPDQ
jgi:hypothetical protein